MSALSGFNLGNSAHLLGEGIDIGKGKGRPTSEVQSGMIFGRGNSSLSKKVRKPILVGGLTYIGHRCNQYRSPTQPI